MKQNQALEILKTGVSVFLTGEPGSGKSYIVNKYVEYLRNHDIGLAVTASTGIAATHIGGTTIHSWAGIGIADFLSPGEINKIAMGQAGKRIQKAKVLILDEVSMIGASTLDLVDAVCRAVHNKDVPFGGIQVVLVGDFFQLPPIARNGEEPTFAFQARAWQDLDPVVCYLSEQHRQADKKFLKILNAIRNEEFDSIHNSYLMECIIPETTVMKSVTKIFPHNINVDTINDAELLSIPGLSYHFEMKSDGPKKLVEVLKKGCMSPENLHLKVGATVMFTKNNPKDGFVNGTLGKVIKISSESGNPVVRTKSGQLIEAKPMEWMIEDTDRILASVTQVPLRLAWAITIHKSQGMSLDAAVMDLNRVFEYGQGYVALSRVKSTAGLHLLGFNEKSLMVHPKIAEKDRELKKLSVHAEKYHQNLANSIKKTQTNFIKESGGSIKPITKKKALPKSKKDKMGTFELTLDLIKKGKKINEICQKRGLADSTVLGHFEKFILEGKITRKDILPLIEPTLKLSLPEIHQAFRDLKTTSLSPVYEKFDGKYSYRDLKIARMALA